MKRLTILIVVFAGLAGAGCSWNLKTKEFPSAKRPEAVTARLVADGTEFVGELLEVRDDAFLVLTRERATSGPGASRTPEKLVRLLPRAGVHRFQLDAPGSPNGNPNTKDWDQTALTAARLLSRFPQGLSPDLLQQLLKSCGQTEVAGIKP